MHIANILRIIGVLIMGYSLTLLPPMVFSLIYQEDTLLIFLYSSLITFLFGFILWFPTRNLHNEVRPREGFLIVTLIWVCLCLVSTLPFILHHHPTLSFIDALFETVSGLTTTGATILTRLDMIPYSILYFRSQLQFIGGGGIILFSIAVLPMLGVGGMQLFRADVPGPFKEEKLTPRLAHTAKTLWLIYVGLVLLSGFCYWLAGMSVFDAINHSFTTVSTGGFSTHDKSLAYFENSSIKFVAIIFMFLGAVNFSLLYIAIRRKTLAHFWQDQEFRVFLLLILFSTILITITLINFHVFLDSNQAFVDSLFQVMSFATTSGFQSANYNLWPTFVPIFLIMLCLIGGSSGSTAGGIKVIRAILLNKQGSREIHRLIHPSGYYVIKLGYSRLQARTLDAIWGFFGVFILVYVVLLVLLQATGLDFVTTFSALAACLSCTGIGVGKVFDNFQEINDVAKVLLSIAMLAGRLELFTLIVLLMPSYWRN